MADVNSAGPGSVQPVRAGSGHSMASN